MEPTETDTPTQQTGRHYAMIDRSYASSYPEGEHLSIWKSPQTGVYLIIEEPAVRTVREYLGKETEKMMVAVSDLLDPEKKAYVFYLPNCVYNTMEEAHERITKYRELCSDMKTMCIDESPAYDYPYGRRGYGYGYGNYY